MGSAILSHCDAGGPYMAPPATGRAIEGIKTVPVELPPNTGVEMNLRGAAPGNDRGTASGLHATMNL